MSSRKVKNKEKPGETVIPLNSVERSALRPLKSGMMMKRGGLVKTNRWRRFELYLQNRTEGDKKIEQYELVYVKEGTNKELAVSLKQTLLFKNQYRISHLDDKDRGCIILSGAQIGDHPDEPTLGFAIKPIGTERVYYLICENEVEKNDWKFHFDYINLTNKLMASKALNSIRREDLQQQIKDKQIKIVEYQKAYMHESAISETRLKQALEAELADSVQRELNFEAQISTLKNAIINSQNLKAMEHVSTVISRLYTDLGGLEDVVNKTKELIDFNSEAKRVDMAMNSSENVPKPTKNVDSEAQEELNRITKGIVLAQERQDRIIDRVTSKNVNYVVESRGPSNAPSPVIQPPTMYPPPMQQPMIVSPQPPVMQQPVIQPQQRPPMMQPQQPYPSQSPSLPQQPYQQQPPMMQQQQPYPSQSSVYLNNQ